MRVTFVVPSALSQFPIWSSITSWAGSWMSIASHGTSASSSVSPGVTSASSPFRSFVKEPCPE